MYWVPAIPHSPLDIREQSRLVDMTLCDEDYLSLLISDPVSVISGFGGSKSPSNDTHSSIRYFLTYTNP